MMKEWNNFKPVIWTKEIDVRNFIQLNYTPYEGDDSFLAGATESRYKLWAEVSELFKKEREILPNRIQPDKSTHIYCLNGTITKVQFNL